MHTKGKWQDISRVIRKNKRLLDTPIPAPYSGKRSNSDKVIEVIRNSKNPLTFTEIVYATEIRSTGNLHNVLRVLMQDDIINKNNGLYNLI